MKQQSPMDMHGFGIKGYPGPPRCGLGEKLTILPRKSHICWETFKIGNQTGTTKMTRHVQGLTIGNVLSLYRKQFLKNLIILYINTFWHTLSKTTSLTFPQTSLDEIHNIYPTSSVRSESRRLQPSWQQVGQEAPQLWLCPVFSVNKNPIRCNSMQIFIYCKVTLHVSGVTAPIIRSTKNCNHSLRCRSYCKIQGLTGMN